MNSFMANSRKILPKKFLLPTLFCFLLLLEISLVSSVGEDFYNPDYTAEEGADDGWGDEILEEVKRHVGSIAAGKAPPKSNLPYFQQNKRFLGAMARNGWFPRQFRGFVEPQFDKRHVGSAAKTGYLGFHRIPEVYNRRFRLGNYNRFSRNLGSVIRGKQQGGNTRMD